MNKLLRIPVGGAYCCAQMWCGAIAVAQAPAPSPPDTVDAFAVEEVFARALTDGEGHDLLRVLAGEIGARPAGSPAYGRAAAWASGVLESRGATVNRQSVTVVPWLRGGVPEAVASLPGGELTLRAITLGNSPATPAGGVSGELVAFTSLDEVDALAEGALAGRVAFFNRPFAPGNADPFGAYGDAVDQRVYGPARASAKGAVATIVRSMTPAVDDVPHTGSTVFPEGVTPIPAISISTLDADSLGAALADRSRGTGTPDPVTVRFTSGGGFAAETTEDNVIAEVAGAAYPDRIILIAGHLDSWDVGEGAHDDGAGSVQAMEVLSLLRRVGYVPRHTLRVGLFSNEERGLTGARAYWAASDSLGLRHLAAIESDRGGFAPRGFTVDAPDSLTARTAAFAKLALPLLEPYGLHFAKGGGGADISGLKDQGAILFGLETDPQRYFDVHHTERDVFAAVHPRELEMGAAAMAALVMLIDNSL